MKSCILVPIKTNNTRLPGKTFRPLNGKPLYTYLFDTLKKLGIDVFVDSSDERVLSVAIEYGFKTFKRPEEYNQDHITGDDLIARDIDNLDYDLVGLLHITSPFLSENTIKTAISLMENPDLDSLFGVVPRYGRFWHEGKPINHNPQKLTGTQFLTPVHEEAADMYFFRKESFKKYGKRVCGNFKIMDVKKTETADIDTMEDFVHAEALIKAGLVNP